MNRQEERKMTVTIAGKKKEIAEKTTIAQIIVSENVENPDYVTVTVNDEFVDSDAFATTELKDGDTVEFLYFMGIPLKAAVRRWIWLSCRRSGRASWSLCTPTARQAPLWKRSTAS